MLRLRTQDEDSMLTKMRIRCSLLMGRHRYELYIMFLKPMWWFDKVFLWAKRILCQLEKYFVSFCHLNIFRLNRSQRLFFLYLDPPYLVRFKLVTCPPVSPQLKVYLLLTKGSLVLPWHASNLHLLFTCRH